MGKIFLIILNWNGQKDTLECFKTLEGLQATGYRLQIIVVDNGSTDKSVESIKDYVLSIKSTEERIKILENKKNLGFAEGNNVGIRYALKNGADYVMLLNNDTLVDKSLISGLVEFMDKHHEVGIVGPKIYFAPGFEYHHDRYSDKDRGKVVWYAGGIIDWQNVLAFHRGVDEIDHGQYDQSEETDFVSGCAMMVRKEVFEKIGLLDNKYYLYYEDNDFCQRAKRAGFKIMYVSQASLYHKNAVSASGVGSSLQDYYTSRNRLLFGWRYAPWRANGALMKESLGLLFGGRNGQKQGVKDFYLGKFGEK